MNRTYDTLDAIVVIGAMLIIGGGVGSLIFFDPPQNNLPIIASLLGTLLGTIVGGYAGFRWGASQGQNNRQAPGTATMSVQATVETPKTEEEIQP
ncbi:hypothetical protein AEAC466_17435 [Asticcacaulis sp. AC466]|uniref:hypothetical protein n=1 Tax=Asticcacaulis sp. AC466 TaxID=1282362 RepID=UPI0003C41229|nr:hypothetical protein [Asticcacaulis sp. AC466]ESQ82406.1 hypothetical protein AEAC466_17435 [Asticcacaulis sp. AC466]